MEPPVRNRVRAPKRYVPPPEGDPEATLAGYRRLGGGVRCLVASAAGLDSRRGGAKALDRFDRRPRLAAGENEPPRLTAHAPGNRANAPWGAVRPDHGARPEALVAG